MAAFWVIQQTMTPLAAKKVSDIEANDVMSQAGAQFSTLINRVWASFYTEITVALNVYIISRLC